MTKPWHRPCCWPPEWDTPDNEAGRPLYLPQCLARDSVQVAQASTPPNKVSAPITSARNCISDIDMRTSNVWNIITLGRFFCLDPDQPDRTLRAINARGMPSGNFVYC